MTPNSGHYWSQAATFKHLGGEFTTTWRTFDDDTVTVDDEPCRVIYADKHPHPIRATYIRHDMRAEAARGVTRGELESAMQSC